MGEGVEEYGHAKGEPENVLVRVDPRYFRPTEVELLLVSAFLLRRVCGVGWLDGWMDGQRTFGVRASGLVREVRGEG